MPAEWCIEKVSIHMEVTIRCFINKANNPQEPLKVYHICMTILNALYNCISDMPQALCTHLCVLVFSTQLSSVGSEQY